MSKPAFQKVWDSYPTEQKPCSGAYDNQCAIRLSIALQAAGVDFSAYSEPKCLHGHARGAESLANFLWRRWGRPKIATSPSVGRTNAKDHKGVLLFRNITGFRNGQGDHIDVWNGTLTKTGEYFDESQQTWFWELV